MIGDWVICSDPTPFRITGIYNKEPYVVTDEDGLEVEIGDLKPIPLTEEILKENGYYMLTKSYYEPTFVDIYYEEWKDYYYIWTCESIENPRKRYYMNLAEVKKDEFVLDNSHFPCKYVHQFQHALRLCGLTELADNFRLIQ